MAVDLSTSSAKLPNCINVRAHIQPLASVVVPAMRTEASLNGSRRRELGDIARYCGSISEVTDLDRSVRVTKQFDG